MEFFSKIKSKLRVKNLLLGLLYLAIACAMMYFAITNGFSSEVQWQFGVRGSDVGIPLPNWVVSGLLVLVAAIFAFVSFGCIKSFIKSTEYNKMLDSVRKIGEVDAVGAMIASMSKNPYTKGCDLRFNQNLLFCLQGTDVTVLAAADIKGIKAEVTKSGNAETHFLCVYHAAGVLKIRSSKKKILPLLDEMRKTFASNHVI